jgi:hypothetical protein
MYTNMFTNLTIPVQQFGQLLGGIQFDQLIGFDAEYKTTVVEGGVPISKVILFVLDEDGIWRVKFL